MQPSTTAFAMLLPGDIADSLAKRLRMYVLRSKVTVTDVSVATQRIGVGGPAAAGGAAGGGGRPARRRSKCGKPSP
jgi:folate-binding Fe-S cluster repair protein YgfZ